MIKFGMPPQLHVDHYDERNRENGQPKGKLVAESLDPINDGEYGWNKPTSGGIWTSTLIDNGWSDWCEWTKGADFLYKPGQPGYVLEVSPSAKIFEINGRNDVKWLKNHYPYITKDDRISQFDFPRFDWTRLAQDFDGVHLTDEGNSKLHCTDIEYSLNAWDAESTIWMKWAFTHVRSVTICDPEDQQNSHRKITIDG